MVYIDSMKSCRLENWGRPVVSTQKAIDGGLFTKPTRGICLGMFEPIGIRIAIEGRSTSSIYHPDFWEFVKGEK